MLVARELKENGIITDEEKAKKVILKGLPTIIRIAEKLWPENHDPEHLEKASDALDEGVENPIHILKQAGIDIEPELEEFREFLAEISGKKIEAKKALAGEHRNALSSGNITLEAQKLLGILSGLKFADYSEKAVEKALKELDARIEKLIEGRRLELLGLYSTVAIMLRKGEFKKAEEFLKKFSG